jgi:hypothetical protein
MKEFLMYLPLIFFFVYLTFSTLVIAYAYKTDKRTLSIDWNAVAKFLAFMMLATMVRLCLFDSGVVNFEKFGLKMSGFLWVWLEDAFYVMIPYYLSQKTRRQWLKFGLWFSFSFLFASGHVYQGYFVAAIIGFYPYYISRRYAVRTSFATVMACHFLYDTITFATLKIAKLFMYV